MGTPCPDGAIYTRLTKLEVQSDRQDDDISDLRADVHGKPGESKDEGLRGTVRDHDKQLKTIVWFGKAIVALVLADVVTRFLPIIGEVLQGRKP